MSKKVSITNTLDLNKLNKEIDEYISKTNETNPYLFMCEGTIKAIPYDDSIDVLVNYFNQIKTKIHGVAGYYNGYKVFKDDSLNFGEVEIR